VAGSSRPSDGSQIAKFCGIIREGRWVVKKYHCRFTLFKEGLRGIFALFFDLGFDGALSVEFYP